MVNPGGNDWGLVPRDEDEVEALRDACRKMVRRRAAMAAGVAAVPLPGVDVVTDVGMFARLVEDTNRAFGLSEEQIGRMHPSLRTIAQEAVLGGGGMLVGKSVTRKIVLAMFRRFGKRIVAKSAGKVVPLAGQIAAAAIGFTVFRKMGYEHVEACAKVARDLLAARYTAHA